jgi:HAD superfamily hydrolase (TIGR01490 family)
MEGASKADIQDSNSTVDRPRRKDLIGLMDNHHGHDPQVLKDKPAACFYDLDGTLCSSNIVHAYGFFARRQPTLIKSFKRTASLISSIPLFFAADAYSRKIFNEMFYRRYRGESENRLRVLGQELFDDVIKPTIYKQAYALVNQSRRAGYRQILVTGALDIVAEPFARHFQMDECVANRLEFSNGQSTGSIQKPLLAGATKATWIRRYVANHNLDMEQCLAYSDSMSDFPMLAVVGKPSVINPDRQLKIQAKSFDWPILNFSS